MPAAGVTDRIEAALSSRDHSRLAWVIFGLATAAYVVVALILTRGATFTFDELTWLVDSDGFRPGSIFEPHYGHLIAVTRVIYAAMLATVGPSELLIRLSMIAAVAGTAILLYVFLRRRLGPLVALAPSIVVLFLGSTPEPLLPSVMSFPQATAFGIGALLLAERRGRLADAGACALLVLSVASLEVGIAFTVAVAIMILLEGGGLRRSWVFLVPAAFFAVWWLWARQFDESLAVASNVLLIPGYAADSMAAAVSGFTGLGRSFTVAQGSALNSEWGRVLAPVLVAAVVWRGARRGFSPRLIALITIPAMLWIGFGLGYGLFRTPDADRYAYVVVVALVLVAAEAFRGVRLTGPLAIGLLLALAFCLPANLFQLRDYGSYIRMNSERVDAELSMIELERDNVSPDFNGGLGFLDETKAGEYLAVVDEHGPIAISPADLLGESAENRTVADQVLRAILDLKLTDAPPGIPPSCIRLPSSGGHVEFPLPQGGVVLRASEPASVGLRRFGDSPVRLPGLLRPGRFTQLAIPLDSNDQPWTATIATSSDVTVCEPEAGTA